MAQFTIKGKVYRSEKIDLFKQIQIEKRIGMVYPALAAARAIYEFDPVVALGYVTTAMNRMSDDDLVFVNQMVCDIMEEVQFSVPYLLVQFGEAEPRLLSVLASDNLLGNLTLKPFQSALLIFLEVKVLNHLTVRSDGKVLDSQIKTHHA